MTSRHGDEVGGDRAEATASPGAAAAASGPGAARGLGTLRFRLLASLAGFTALAAVGITLSLAGREERDELLGSFSRTWARGQAAARLERCVADLHRQSTLLSQGFTGAAGEALAADVRSAFEADLASCSRIVPLLSDEQEASVAPPEVEALLADLGYVIRSFGVDHVAAISRLALEVDPAAERLAVTTFPGLRADLSRELERLQAEIGAVGARGDRTLLIALVGPMVAFALIAGLLLRRVLGSLRALEGAMSAFGAGQLDHRAEVGGRDEFTAVALRINAMAERLASSQRELSTYAAELERSLASLKDAQETAVEQQKLAALGELVAGVAHEVNTPLGVAVTSASLVEEHLRTLREASDGGTATRGLLRRLTADLDEVVRPLQDNLARAARLISSFKQVAVDRGSITTRTAPLDQWAAAVRQSLAPALRQHRVVVSLEVAPVRLRMAAGELEQVLSNLILNACMHAFPDASEAPEGAVREVRVVAEVIGGRPDGEALALSVQDSGCGMSPEVAARVFEPFFTTRRGRGGSGLGMHIVHQLVQERFRGRVELQTAVGQGTRWTLTLPMPTEALAVVERDLEGDDSSGQTASAVPSSPEVG
jgi:signal transduction histidine kinase